MKYFIVPLFFLFFISPKLFAASPLIVTPSGAVGSWGGSSITYHPELGECSHFTNGEMVSTVSTALDLWDLLSDVDLGFVSDTGQLPDIDSTNYTTYLFTGSGTSTDLNAAQDGIFPVVFDDDGEITSALTGPENVTNVLGFAAPTTYDQTTGEIIDGQAVFNCRCVAGHPRFNDCVDSNGNTVSVTDDDLSGTIIHEIGHFLGLDHSQVNLDAFNSTDTTDDDDIPIMFPISFVPPSGWHATADDDMSLGQLYPSVAFSSSHCQVTGALLDVSGEALRCADVQAVTSDPADTVAFVSGAIAIAQDNNGDGDTVDTGECESGCGDFRLFLEPGKSYTIKVKPIDSSFTGGSSLSPCVNGQLTTIVAEDIGEITGADCTSGGSHSLGDITTTSTAGSSSSSGSSSGTSGGSGGGAFGGSSEDPNGYWCALHAEAGAPSAGSAASQIALAGFCLAGFVWLKKRRNCAVDPPHSSC